MPDQPGPERIQKILAQAGIASRRALEKMILEGRITLNGVTATLGDRATPELDEIAIDGVPVPTVDEKKYFALNKPRGVVSTASDTHGRRTVLDFLPEDIKNDFRLFPVGRLDIDSSGLILLTNDGFLANRLMHPRFGVPREYVVEVEPVPAPRDIACLRRGVDLEDGNTGPARASIIGKYGPRTQVKIIVHTGMKRQIRRSFEHLGYEVKSLHRVRYGKLGLGKLPEGETRELKGHEVEELYRQTGLFDER